VGILLHVSPDEHETDESLGRGTGRQGPWKHDEGEDESRAGKQEADPSALEVEGDPRGGLQSEEYRTADPRDLVEEGGTVMAGPGGAPQEGLSIEERKEHGEKFRRERAEDEPHPGRD
jgi:hypothetical protein